MLGSGTVTRAGNVGCQIAGCPVYRLLRAGGDRCSIAVRCSVCCLQQARTRFGGSIQCGLLILGLISSPAVRKTTAHCATCVARILVHVKLSL